VVAEDVVWARVGRARDGWFLPAGQAAVTIGLEWKNGGSDFTTGHCWVGARCDRVLDGGAELNARIVRLLERRRDGYPRSTGTWPAFRTVPGVDGEYRLDLGLFRDRVVGEIVETWRVVVPFVDEGVAAG